MAFELDHMFVTVRPGAPEIATLVTAGFQEGQRNRHAGQGTASTGVFFENAYVEFLWLEDRAAAGSTPIRRTRLAQRADPGQRALPFGFGLRSTLGAPEPAPFATWDYRPPYVPAGTAIPTASNSENLAEPLLFLLPWKSGPGYECPEHPNGARGVTEVSLTVAATGEMSAEFAAFASLGLVGVEVGAVPLLEVQLDNLASGAIVDLRPEIPFLIRW
jgi:hypothetical protein